MEQGWFVGITGKVGDPVKRMTIAASHVRSRVYSFNRRQSKPPAMGIGNNDYAANFNDFLDAAPKGKPWCFWYGAVEPHRNYEYQSGVRIGGKQLQDIDRVPGYWPDTETVRHDMLDYALEVEHVDNHFLKRRCLPS